jgi:hypothetical protein
MGTARRILEGCGTQTAALGFGGYLPPSTAATEEYDGTSWTAGGSMGTARFSLAGCRNTNCWFRFWWIYST